MTGEPALLSLQQARNAETRDAWESFAEHRGKVMALLNGAARSEGSTLCLIGAGNCNDIDLSSLSQQYDRIELVDWDADALQSGVSRQLLGHDRRIVLRGSVDVTSIGDALSRWNSATVGDRLAFPEVCRHAASASLPADVQPADTVASLCILSQLVELCAAALPADDPRLLTLVQAVRLGHLRQLALALRPGGKGILITDLVSSDTAPELKQATPAELPAILHRLLVQRNFFTGLHPQALLGEFQSDPVLRHLTADCLPTAPWRWSLGPRTYAVFALIFRSSRSDGSQF